MREYQRQVRVKRIQAVIARLNPASGQRKGSIERSIQQRAESPATDQQQVESRDPTLLSSIHTALGAGRLDPFDVYLLRICQSMFMKFSTTVSHSPFEKSSKSCMTCPIFSYFTTAVFRTKSNYLIGLKARAYTWPGVAPSACKNTAMNPVKNAFLRCAMHSPLSFCLRRWPPPLLPP